MLFNSNNFYPTKKETAYKLFNMFYEADKKAFSECIHILEPSAGKGDLIEAFYNFLTDKEVKIYEDINSKESDVRKQLYYNREKIYQDKLKKYKIDAIEIDGTLRNILLGKNIITHENFQIQMVVLKYNITYTDVNQDAKDIIILK